MQIQDIVRLLKNDLDALMRTIPGKYYRDQLPFGMNAAQFRLFALDLIRQAVDSKIRDEEFLKKNLPS